ncbi:hypothetical protein K523DRAFT_9886 [Schizophyllum commune Tattone D]|nr:hypothetical protein K523DRAFT_9886 [Schizophyllum commune Tattone D]
MMPARTPYLPPPWSPTPCYDATRSLARRLTPSPSCRACALHAILKPGKPGEACLARRRGRSAGHQGRRRRCRTRLGIAIAEAHADPLDEITNANKVPGPLRTHREANEKATFLHPRRRYSRYFSVTPSRRKHTCEPLGRGMRR